MKTLWEAIDPLIPNVTRIQQTGGNIYYLEVAVALDFKFDITLLAKYFSTFNISPGNNCQHFAGYLKDSVIGFYIAEKVKTRTTFTVFYSDPNYK